MPAIPTKSDEKMRKSMNVLTDRTRSAGVNGYCDWMYAW